MSTIHELIGKLEKAASNLVTLKVVTRVGSVRVDRAEGAGAAGEGSAGGSKALVTTIDLVQGDITTEIDPAFLGPESKALWDFHATRERQAAEIVKGNIEAIERLLKIVGDRL